MNIYPHLAFDGIGKDSYTATAGSPNAGDNRDLYIWDAFWMWKASSIVNVTFGIFRPQAARSRFHLNFYVTSLDQISPGPAAELPHGGDGLRGEKQAQLAAMYLGPGWSLNYNAGCSSYQ